MADAAGATLAALRDEGACDPRSAAAAKRRDGGGVAAALLPVLATTLQMPIEELIGIEAKKSAPGKRGPAPKIQRQLERVNQLPRSKQRVVSEVLDSLLAQSR
jgi:hypothetical protein